AAVTQAEIRKRGGDSEILEADIRDAGQVAAAVAECRKRFGRVDILVNNVAVGAVGSVVDTSPEDWDRVIAVNLRGAYLACKYTVPTMIEQAYGRIVNISSLAAYGYTGKPLAAYGASKAGLHGLSRDLAVHFGACGIRANTIVIGLIDTPMIRRYATAIRADQSVEDMMRSRDAQVPTGRQGSAWDVANVVCFAASDLAQFINGAEIVVDGGSSAKSS
ncbi:MAG TPA: SDR family NAD(P)-dependent oxidoreductase, partial [Mycobacterium sp.]|nr:SDR family NAD(P)-dependent oxidoreductase [Mycobacterium sp.]